MGMLMISSILFLLLWLPAILIKAPKGMGLVDRAVGGWEEVLSRLQGKLPKPRAPAGLQAKRSRFRKEKALRALYPLSHADRKRQEFDREKHRYIFYVLLLACSFAFFAALDAQLDEEPAGNALLRSPPGGTERSLVLEADSSEGKDFGEIGVKVEPRMYTETELSALYETMLPALEKAALNGNPDADHVTKPLYLMETLQGFPFRIKWQSGDYELMDDSGRFMRNDFPAEGSIVMLKALISCQSFEREYSFPVILRTEQLTEAEQEYRDFLEAVKASLAEDPSGEKAFLPERFRGYTLSWSKPAGNTGFMILGMGILIAILMGAARENHLEELVKERDRKLLLAYPDFVNRLSLYMGAGMSISSCLIRIAAEHGNAAGGGGTSYLHQELKYTVNELAGGVSERDAIEGFGKRCGLPGYIKLTTLLVQNLRKGGSQLLPRLKEEAEDAFAMRKNLAREAGEQAGTKLIFPMLLMMAVVMVVIIVPAFTGFEG